MDVEKLRRQPPLPETADELGAEAGGRGVSRAELGKTIHLGARAAVSQMKALSASGELAAARVVEFATHGFIADETAHVAKSHAEPALLMMSPDKASIRQ